MKSVRDAEVHDKIVFLRVDFNVPIDNGKIEDSNRIEAAVPTIKFLLDKGAKIVIGTHLGRPEGKFNPEFSTMPLARKLSEILGKAVEGTDLVVDKSVADKISIMKPGDIFVLGNLRFDPREESNDVAFAKELADYADIYVNDAFAVSHRANASVEAITKYLPSYAGLLMESEITTLDLLLMNPDHPFVLIVGGAKIVDKAGFLDNLADKADQILVGGAVANTFKAAKGEDISKSLAEPKMIESCKNLLTKHASKIHLPTDSVQKATEGGFEILDIGVNTRNEFSSFISAAKCIFWNGNMGKSEDEEYRAGTQAIADAVGKNGNTTVVAGGDTVGFINQYAKDGHFSFVSTGGGATMQYLAGEKLPGIEAINNAFS